MGKLNIAHHKSYHPYRRDNIEKVRRDEEEAALKEAREEGRMSLADSEARIALLRERAGAADSKKNRKREDEKHERELLEQATNPEARREALALGPITSALPGSGLGSGKHINLFEELEQSSSSSSLATQRALEKLGKGHGKGKESVEMEKGIPLAPSAKDLRPWYSEKRKVGEGEDERGRDDKDRNRDLFHKNRSDPLTAIQRELAAKYPSNTQSQVSSAYSTSSSRARTWGGPPSHPSRPLAQTESDPRSARESRETSERERAQALRERKRREAGSMSATPSTVRGGDDAFRYGNQFNRQEVAEAHRRRDGGGERDVRERGWGGERVRRDRGREEWRGHRR